MALITSPDRFNIGDSAQRKILEGFLTDLERFLGVQVESVSVADLWEQMPPEKAGSLTMREYLGEEVSIKHIQVHPCMDSRFDIGTLGCDPQLRLQLLAKGLQFLQRLQLKIWQTALHAASERY